MEKHSICRICIFMHAREIFQHARDIISMIVYSCVLGRKEFGSEKGCRMFQKDECFTESASFTEQDITEHGCTQQGLKELGCTELGNPDQKITGNDDFTAESKNSDLPESAMISSNTRKEASLCRACAFYCRASEMYARGVSPKLCVAYCLQENTAEFMSPGGCSGFIQRVDPEE